MNKALLLIDRGSKEYEVRKELDELCKMISNTHSYDARYCFLEVIPPYIEEGIRSFSNKQLTIFPYFLYPGLKLKSAILESRRIVNNMNNIHIITDCLHYHPNLPKLVMKRVKETKIANNIMLDDKECDLLLIGHGSSDVDARLAFEQIYDEIRDNYRNAYYAFLELDNPSIQEAIKYILADNPKMLIIMPYFLHYGTHMKYDIMREISVIKDTKVILTKHLGVSKEIVEIIIDKVRYEG